MYNNIQHKYDVFVRRLGRVSFQIIMYIRGNNRPSSYPYISGDSFRAIADHIHEETLSLNPANVSLGDTVFVSQGLLLCFLQKIHPQIDKPYILICHNGDEPVDEKVTALLDDKIIHFFAQDVVTGHPKITPIPIGLENLHYYIAGVSSFFTKLRVKIKLNPPTRRNKIFFNFSLSTNPGERGPARKYFLSHTLLETVDGFLTPRRHSRLLTTYKFVASPPGNAIESCRTWEALYLNTIPIVKDFAAMRYFKSLGLPIWIVKDWNELQGLTEEALSKKYDELIEHANWESLYMKFWLKKISEIKNEAKSMSVELTSQRELIKLKRYDK